MQHTSSTFLTHSSKLCILKSFFFFVLLFLKSVSKKRGLRRKSITRLFPTHLRNQEHKSRGCSAKLVSISIYLTKTKPKSISSCTADTVFAVHSQSRTSPCGFCVSSRVPEISNIKAAAVLLSEASSLLRCGSITEGIL